MQVISTGSKALDALLLGGVRRGLLYCVFGASGSGKTQLCMQLALNSAMANKSARVFIVDAKGDFRPERIIDIYKARMDGGEGKRGKGGRSKHGNDTYMNSGREGESGYNADINTIMGIMDRIYVQRAYHVDDIFSSLRDVDSMYERYDHGVSFLIVEDSPSLFRLEYGSKSAEGHFRLMRLMHDLALRAVLRNTAVIVTNGVASSARDEHEGVDTTVTDLEMKERQIMDRSVSMFAHFKVRLERLSSKMKDEEGMKAIVDGSVFRATLLQPLVKNNKALFKIVERGIVDI
ncbi:MULTISPECIES: ATPase domain-containing protein [Candidatus Nitrosocaldus]|jgi:RecA/RadA recombinase|uniref:DNA repair and recombination protein RadA n=1 Tax=Candidatus Nitrosocaldus cavascurensis TaxID=2058097 RepID=A0A2K5AT40_9ARCH|nr:MULTISPECIES: ATPase domain-containing protein [Candidatus Nitrosocaldus]SPC34812.1 Putative DNA repair and recombination protein RadA [Candidatus Nitrosocaldus cavascurensis]